ncbi:MAG TPA: hypothetical protein ENN40_08805 [Candidatus Aminicenantes bacterium]|nr:hypothetical protein [Candidatus Aminicenantes bacterium]
MTGSRQNIFRLRILQGLILLVPLPFGSAPEPFVTIFSLVLVIWIALAWPDIEGLIPLPGGRWLARLVMLLPVVALVQLIPLPRGLVGAIHPGALPLLDSLPMAASDWLPLSLAPGITFGVALHLLALTLFFITFLRLPVGRLEARGISFALLVSAGVQVLIGATRMLMPNGKFFLFFYPVDNPMPWAALTGTFVDAAQAALFIGMALLAGLGMWAAEAGLFSSRGPRPSTLKQWLFPGSITGSHLALIAVCVAGFALVRNKNLFWLMTGAGTVALLLWLFTRFAPDYRRRLSWIFLVAMLMAMAMGITRTHPRFQEQRTGDTVSMDTTPAIKNMIRDFPVLGTGFGTFSQVNPVYIDYPELHLSHARNEWLEATAEGGLFSLALLVSALLLYLWGMWHGWSNCPDRWARGAAAGMLAAAMLFWGTCFFHYPLRVPGLVFPGLLLMALAARLVTCKGEKR